MAKSVYQLICDNMTDGVLDPGFSLPEEDADPKGIHFAPGAMDGIYLYHMAHSQLSAAQAKVMGKALRAASGGDRTEAERIIEEWTKDNPAVSVVDELQEYVIRHSAQLDAGNLRQFVRNLMLYSANAECVKVGLALLEIFANIDDRTKETVRRLGHYEEFSLFAIWNMLRWEDGNQEVFALAKDLHGWGRIHAVSYLKPESEEICRWLLLEGVQNSVLTAYSALPCWEKSQAERVLFGNPASEEYAGLSAIISGLLDEGPVPGISEIENAPDVLSRFLEITPLYPLGENEIETIECIKQWAENAGGSCLPLASDCSRILANLGNSK